MNRIRNDFIRRELRALLGLLCAMAPLLAYLVFYARSSPLLFLLLPLLGALFLARMARQAADGLKKTCGVRSESWQARVEEEYAAPHPVCRVAYGEMHLLPSCLVCRHKRRLLLIPTDGIAGAEERFRLMGARRVPILRLAMDSGKTLQIDFSARRCGDGEKAVGFLAQRIGEERVHVCR